MLFHAVSASSHTPCATVCRILGCNHDHEDVASPDGYGKFCRYERRVEEIIIPEGVRFLDFISCVPAI